MPTVSAYAAPSATEPLVPTTIERRETGPNDVLIAIRYAGICHSDIHLVRGDRGPVLFRQQRVGLDGTHFKMLKFRSMYTDAEERKAALSQPSPPSLAEQLAAAERQSRFLQFIIVVVVGVSMAVLAADLLSSVFAAPLQVARASMRVSQ